MRLKMGIKDAIILIGLLLILLLLATSAWTIYGSVVFIFLQVFSFVFILSVVVEIYRRLNENRRSLVKENKSIRKKEYQQFEALMSLYFTLKPNQPLPNTRGWAASPDLLKKLVEIISLKKPNLVVEASSGVSTVVIAHCLQNLGVGKVVSLEHDEKFAEITKSYIKLHALENIATVVHAPLKKYEIQGQEYTWYDIDCLDTKLPIDVVFVDGPPGGVQKLSRYPVLPLLYSALGSEAIIVVDDGKRKDEKEMVRLWEEEFSTITYTFLELEKGAFIVNKCDG